MFKILFSRSVAIFFLGFFSVAHAETCPLPGNIVAHKENGGYVYSAIGGWKSSTIFNRDEPPRAFFRAKFDSDNPFHPTEGGKLAFCAYKFNDGHTLTLKLPEEKRKAILSDLKNWRPLSHGTVYSCGGEGLKAEDCFFKKLNP